MRRLLLGEASSVGKTVAFILTFVAHVVLSTGLGFIFGRRSTWSRARVALVAALPIPIILWGLGAVLLGVVAFAPADFCNNEGCAGPMIGVAAMTIIGFIAYALGIIFALVDLQFGRPKLKDSLHDVFE